MASGQPVVGCMPCQVGWGIVVAVLGLYMGVWLSVFGLSSAAGGA